MAQLASTTVFGELLVTAKSLLQGNVGIGTTSPSWKLHVSHSSGGDATYSGGILIENTSTTAGEPNIGFKNAGMGSNFWFVGPNQDTDMNFAYGTTHSDANTKMTIASDGNVGIGTTAPSEKLEVVGNIRLVGAGGTGDGSLEIWRGTNASWKILNTSGKLKFQSNFTSSVGNYYDAMILDYNTGNLWFKGSLTGGTVPWERISGAPSTFNPATHTHSNITITAGNGLSGGGTLASNRTITLGTPGTITTSTSNEVTSTSHTHALTLPTTATRWPSWSEVTDKPSTFAPSSHTHAWSQITSVPSASTSAKGIVQLSTSTSSTSTTLAATASAVKSAYDLANSKWTYNEATIKAVKVNSAGTADTLATARTINGTSFNGSANITTANWGTARTLTIGNTGKSVNGSANVSWSLSEIGAAPASHTHNYLPLSGGVLTGELTVPERLNIRQPNTTGGWARNIAYQTPDGSSTQATIYFYGSGASISRIGINYGGYSSSDGIHIVKSSGNVGIGTTSPSYPLHVIGDVGFSGTLQAGTVPWARISGAPATATRWPSWGEVTGKPSTFTPSSHTHSKSDVGLGSVQNYGIATQAQAQAGTANNVYMTPLRVKEAISSLPPSSHTHQVVLTTTLNTTWQGSQAPYTKTQTVSGLLATDTPIVDVVMSGTFATDQARIEAWGYVYRITTANNSITLYATEKPTVSLPIQLKVVR